MDTQQVPGQTKEQAEEQCKMAPYTESEQRAFFEGIEELGHDDARHPKVVWHTRKGSLPQKVVVTNFDIAMGHTENPRDLWLTSEGYVGRFGVDLFHTKHEAAQCALPHTEAEEAEIRAHLKLLEDRRWLLNKFAASDE